MTAMIVRWRKPDPAVVSRWLTPDGSTDSAAETTPPRPLAAVIGPPGPPGDQAPPYVHTQASAAAEWIVNHNLGWRPQVTVLSAGGIEVEASVTHTSVNQARVNFNDPQSGSALVR